MEFSKPIVFLDIEATGADATRDRIVELALVKVHPDGRREERTHRINPGMRIPAEVITIHHITNEDIQDCPPFKEFAPALLDFLDGCDLAGFGITRFDVPLLIEEFKRCGLLFSKDNRSIIDSLVIYHQKERRDLSAAYQFYCQKTLEGAHGARADTLASIDVFFAQMERYPDLPQIMEELHQFCNKQDERFVDASRKFMWKDGEAAINFGKHKGSLLRILVKEQRDYVEWMVSDGKFSQDVIDICWKALRGEFPRNAAKNGA